jgi:hypothetical protein
MYVDQSQKYNTKGYILTKCYTCCLCFCTSEKQIPKHGNLKGRDKDAVAQWLLLGNLCFSFG